MFWSVSVVFARQSPRIFVALVELAGRFRSDDDCRHGLSKLELYGLVALLGKFLAKFLAANVNLNMIVVVVVSTRIDNIKAAGSQLACGLACMQIVDLQPSFGQPNIEQNGYSTITNI